MPFSTSPSLIPTRIDLLMAYPVNKIIIIINIPIRYQEIGLTRAFQAHSDPDL